MKPIPLEAATLLGEGRVDEAIRVVRQGEGLGRREARARINAYIAQEPLLGVQIGAQLAAKRRKWFFWFLIVDILVVAAFIYWFKFRGLS